MKNRQELLKIIKDISKRALEGRIKLEEFYAQWPKEADTNLLFKKIYEDIEDAIEHLPRFWLKPGIDYKSWHNSYIYITLYLDFILLDYDKSYEELMNCREIVLKENNFSQEMLVNKVKAYFDSAPS